MRLRLFLMFTLAVAVWACTSDSEPSNEIAGFDFFPLQTGTYIIYNVDSVSISQNVETPFTYQLRVSTLSSFTNAEGNTSFVLQRHTRADETQPWKPAGTWTAWKTSRQAVVSEGNTSYVKLQFPVSVGLGWNGNALNDLGGSDRCSGTDCDRYSITEIDPLLVVTQDDQTDVLTKDVRLEKYQKNIGLVYKESTIYQYCESGSCFGNDFIVQGLRYKMEIASSGTL